MKTLAALIFSVLFGGSAFAQVLCTPIGQSLYCAGPNQQSTMTPLSRNQAVITTPHSMTPLTVLPKAKEPGDLTLKPLEPLHDLKPLTRGLDDTMNDDPLNILGQSLLLGD